MTLKTGTPPEQAFQVAMTAINGLRKEASHLELSDSTSLETPLKVFVLRLEDVADRDLEKATETGWRYTIYAEQNPVAAIEVDSAGTEEWRFSHLNQGPFVIELVKAQEQAENLSLPGRSSYEERFLKIPALYVMALWLHSEADDILIPMPPVNDSLVPNEPYSSTRFFDHLAPAADLQISFGNRKRK